ncbi:MAG: pyridoxal 5'-phosphate synthase glutaminase subunit PdxT [Prevotella sp.]|nr:pyridoxal 5'-phosphate synthase glutaminase subunit PdxT [Prevotella sp.]
MSIAVLALQGAFVEHEQMLKKLGVDAFEVRQLADWNRPKDGLIIPGGESTTMIKLLHELDLYVPIKEAIKSGLPVFGTCAGLILLGKNGFSTMNIDVKRNAYGRQLGSFYTNAPMEGVGEDVPMTFIRAPYINKVWGNVQILAEVDGHIVAAQQDNQLVTAFHPELNDDTRVHAYFLNMVLSQNKRY